jgi:5-methylphenazine-1-carboxylate 1-monooxygenase
MKISIVGAGIGGLTLALALHRAGLSKDLRLFEAAPEFKPLGVGINLMPHAVNALTGLGLLDNLRAVAVEPRQIGYYTHHGQLIHNEPVGRSAGYHVPHFSIHRADLHKLLLDAVHARIGPDAVVMDRTCTGFDENEQGVDLTFDDSQGNSLVERNDVVIACDGIHSAIRRQLYPGEGPPRFQGINMWRGVTRMEPYLGGDTVVRVGALFRTGKLAIYPIRNDIDADGRQLVNWVAETADDHAAPIDWSAPGKLEDFYDLFENWTFEWLDCAKMLRDADTVLSYPMVDRDPIDRWVFGRVALLGDAAHPMHPRGGNGGAQSILDAIELARCLADSPDIPSALQAYQEARLATVNALVLRNRSEPPDVIIEKVEERTSGQRFSRIEDVMSVSEIDELINGYKRAARYDMKTVSG